jgi:hypothetical protein
MNNFEKHIDKIVEKVLNESLREKSEKLVSQIVEKMETNEKLQGNQHKIDVAEPKGKITADDFKKLRTKKDMKEYTMGDDQIEKVEPYGDFSTDSPKKVGKVKNVGYNYEKKVAKEFNENDMEEGNAFSGALSRAKEEGKSSFEVDGKTYPVKEAKDDKWIQDVDMKKGAFTKWCSRKKMVDGDGDVTCECATTAKKIGGHPAKMAQLYLNMNKDKCKNLQESNSNKKVLKLYESEIIDLIEMIIKEQKSNMQKKSSSVEPDFNKISNKNKEVNQDHLDAVVKKMKDYLKTGSEGTYEMDPEGFPVGNGEMKQTPKKAYKASDAVEEYIDAFAFPGQTNLVYDEIKPNDEWIEANLKGSSKTGNAQVDKDGKALGNVVPSKVGDKFYKNFEDNVYGAEQMNASYKRYPQPVDQAGESTEQGALNLKKGAAKSQKILNQLESVENKNEKIISEEINRMKKIVDYNQKTQ